MYLISTQTSLHKTSSMGIRTLVVYKIIDKSQYILMDIEDKTLNGIFHLTRLMQAI